jgi:hypothetical protein
VLRSRSSAGRKPARQGCIGLSRMSFSLLLDPKTAALHWLWGGGLGEIAGQVAAALALEGAQLRPDPLGRDMSALGELINAVAHRHEEVAVACRLLRAFDGAAG